MMVFQTFETLILVKIPTHNYFPVYTFNYNKQKHQKDTNCLLRFLTFLSSVSAALKVIKEDFNQVVTFARICSLLLCIRIIYLEITFIYFRRALFYDTMCHYAYNI